jgi:hypothetical protein
MAVDELVAGGGGGWVKEADAGGRRTDRISARDLEVLQFVVRFGVVPREPAAIWAGTRRAATLKRERRLRLVSMDGPAPAAQVAG